MGGEEERGEPKIIQSLLCKPGNERGRRRKRVRRRKILVLWLCSYENNELARLFTKGTGCLFRRVTGRKRPCITASKSLVFI